MILSEYCLIARVSNMENESQRISLKFLLYTTLYESNIAAPSNPEFRFSNFSNNALHLAKFSSKVKGHSDL